MTYGGAQGKTAEEIEQVLRFPFTGKKLPQTFARLLNHLDAVQAEGNVQLSLANSLWPQKGYPVSKRFLELMKKYYGTSVTPLDYKYDEPGTRARINDWVEEKTKKKIKELLKNPLSRNTKLLLVNAVYFKGNWKNKFEKARTKEAPFFLNDSQTADVPLMTQKDRFMYGRTDTMQMLELRYAGQDLSMLVLLPSGKNTDELTKLEKELTAPHIAHWRTQLRETEITVFLPKFKITWGAVSLTGPLKQLGIHEAFSSKADLSGIGQELCITDILQKAFVDVNEEGTEAAAATAVMVATKGMFSPPQVFRADHPFLFLIQDNATGDILFLGRVSDPS
jgi:serpin B